MGFFISKPNCHIEEKDVLKGTVYQIKFVLLLRLLVYYLFL